MSGQDHVDASPGPAPAAAAPAAALVADPLEGRHLRQKIVELGLLAATLMAAIPALAIFGFIITKGAPAISWEFLFEMPLSGMTRGGILPALVGTLWLIAVELTLSVPIGVLAGIYLSEYAGDGPLTRVIDLAVVNLAGVPSIVHALFGLGAFVLFLELGTSIIAAALTLGVMTLPVVITSTKSALQAVPHNFRVACWNLGATRWQTIWHVVLPNALPGILTGVILQISRSAGETAPVMFTGAAYYLPIIPTSVYDQTMTLSMHVYALVTQVPNVPESMKYGTALVLLGVVLLFNTSAIALRYYLRRNRRW